MPNEYEIVMIHRMRSVVTVVADSEGEAREKAYSKSFDDNGGAEWEESDTDYLSVDKGRECDAEDE